MAKFLPIAIACSVGGVFLAVWYFCADSHDVSTLSQQTSTASNRGVLSDNHARHKRVSLDMPHDVGKHAQDSADVLREKCESEGVLFNRIAVQQKETPVLPAAFVTEIQGSWPKVISKLEDRYGFVPVYQAGDTASTNAPARITQIGSYLYFGQNEAEIQALKLLTDGSVEERSAALDQFGDDAGHAVSLFLALQKRDAEPQIRIEATQKLQSYPSERVISGLVQALGDEEDAVQSAARASLIWIGDQQVLRALRVAAKSKDERIAEMATAILEENLERH